MSNKRRRKKNKKTDEGKIVYFEQIVTLQKVESH